MIRFKQFISEMFDSRNGYNYTNKGRGNYQFDSNTGQIYVRILPTTVVGGKEYEIEFEIWSQRSGRVSYYPSGGNDLAGSLKTYNTIIAICNDYFNSVRLNHGDSIVFAAAHPKTVKIYHRLAKILVKEIGGSLKYQDGTDRPPRWIINK